PLEAEARPARVARLRRMIGALVADDRRRARERRRAPPPCAEALPGEVLATDAGPLHRIATYLAPDHRHGRVPIVGALGVDPATVARLALDDAVGAHDPRGLLYLDTETTGLAGGTGTLPFLIGMAWFEDESLRVEQLLLRRPGEEGPMLARLAERLEAASGVVTYNGKSYDWPLLRNRFVLNRVPATPPAVHIDLLHCARRVFRRRLRRVPLTHVEEAVLGMRRERDIDGAEIPDRFWEVVRGADPSRLAPVIEHNANDVIALAAILAVLVERYDAPAPHHEPEDRLAIAEVAWRAADEATAGLHARAAAEGGGDAELTADALVLAAEVARRRKAHRERAELLHAALAASDDPARRGRTHLALAKVYEHGLRDLGRALLHARLARTAENDEAHERRVARLLRRLARSAPLPASPASVGCLAKPGRGR
ncbi:MAG: ribonuclease H-like domain-containing protein, partial [Sandaracinaceae bacterium]